jgi:molybdopterin/thiamine biosynthesis adenylyltransferase
MKITLIGCGFLGSLWAEEVFKRLYAVERTDVEFLFVDMDIWEKRNAANQIITPEQEGEQKVTTLAKRATAYGFKAVPYPKKITRDNMDDLDGDIMVDALDNVETRWLIWERAQMYGAPLLHLGIVSGAGDVEWSLPDGAPDYWHLSPTVVAKLPDGEQVKLPPCHLVQSRGLGLNLAVAGAKALTLALGEDIEEMLEMGPQLNGMYVYTNWTATNFGHAIDTERLYVTQEEAQEEAEAQPTDEGEGDECT